MQIPNQPQIDLPVKFTDIAIPQINKGMVMEEYMSYQTAPDDCLTWLENADNDASGLISTRREFKRNTAFAGHVTSPVKVVQVNNLDQAVASQLFWQQGNDLKQQPLATAGSLTSYPNFFTSTNKNRFDTLQGYLVLTNNGTATSVYTHTGNTATPVTLDTKFASFVDLISAGFNGRIWGAGSSDKLNRLYYSDVIPTSGIYGLTTATQQYLLINLGTELITALLATQQVLLVFALNKIIRVWGINQLDNLSISNVGTVSQESVIRTPDGIFFYHPSGIYTMSEVGLSSLQPTRISDPIYYLLKRVPPANQKNVFAFGRDQFVYFYLGQLTGLDSTKYWFIRYNTVNKSWSIGSTKTAILCATSGYLTNWGATESATNVNWYPDIVVMTATDMATLDVIDPSTDNQSIYGDFNSSSNISDNISVDIRTKWHTFGIENHKKRINGIHFPHINGNGLNVAVQLDTDKADKWTVIGTLDDNAVTEFNLFQSDPFNRVKFRIYGTSYGGRVQVGMPTIRVLDNLGYATN